MGRKNSCNMIGLVLYSFGGTIAGPPFIHPEDSAMPRVMGLVAVMALALLLGGGLQGQDKDTPAKFKGTLPANWGKLGLSDEQKQKVYKVQSEHHDKIAALEKQVKDLKA